MYVRIFLWVLLTDQQRERVLQQAGWPAPWEIQFPRGDDHLPPKWHGGMFITPSAGLGSPHQNVLSSAEPEVRGVLPLLFSGSSDLCGAVLCSQGCCDRQTAASALPRSLIHVFLFWNRTTTVGEKNNKKWTTSAYISSLTFVGVGGILKAIVAFFPASIVPCVNVPLKSLLGSSF